MSLTSSTTGGASSLDDAPVSSFHRRIMVVAMGGPFCDGYLLGVMGVALGLITPALALDTLWTGLIAASVLVGVFIGGAVFGPITDRVGRHLMYVLNLATFVVFSALQFFVTEAWQLLVLRLLIGIAIGADYPIASALTTELVPRRMRGPALSGLVLAWWVGYGVSYWVGWALTGLGDDSWRWMLASGTVPALIFLFMRAGIPESPRWLASRGRMDEAKAVVRKHLGQEVSDEELLAEGRQEQRGGSGLGNLVEIFKRGYTVPVVFCSVFWICQVAPAFAVRSFQPQMLSAFGVGSTYGASALITTIAVAGIGLGLVVVNRIGRRSLLISSFVCINVSLIALAVLPLHWAFMVVALFAAFQFFEAAGSGLQFVYPSELFPTDLRATGVGIATAMSRVGSATSTFLLPIAADDLGVRGTLGIAVAITLVGLVVSYFLAPETKDLGLTEASSRS
ncbi:sugar porter family MFS transporter [Streptomyces phaeochromogenes]|uniref:Sugar porter family MFS transporter n=1 Tax=Streptomyces phaeochromogenes TaxID=1923 RepID=A0ABZ1H2F6_STRPH|nr:MFS transporter [Streptomyces phaeochromogenes]MCX5602042.1 sugar porter family MFS transporter [Streptomyces phaeochromogenes]WRZ27167.1 sugar porter family MFS transporter [Streptomyces phaeochromogenes]WSD12732.1 sugar porter family MFS transporter [Streptomyces phaeochromogenes]WSJ10473.1 sugar porter family MFS transporter [Streptomyces phaeochromogenes]